MTDPKEVAIEIVEKQPTVEVDSCSIEELQKHLGLTPSNDLTTKGLSSDFAAKRLAEEGTIC